MKKSLVFLCFAMMAYTAQSRAEESTSTFDNFYTVQESVKSASPSLSPFESIQDIFEQAGVSWSELKGQILSLLSFDHHQGSYGNYSEAYMRKTHFGDWIRDPKDGTCFNTRARVLIRDSLSDVTYTGSNCTVQTGQWEDPYTGKTVRVAKEIEVDHFVPLKHAYISGAHRWNYARRCMYANYMGNDFHLLSVFWTENRRKGDKAPDAYLPPEEAFHCDYIATWLKVKLIWGLQVNPNEKEALVRMAQAKGCDRHTFEYSTQELVEQRQIMAANMGICGR